MSPDPDTVRVYRSTPVTPSGGVHRVTIGELAVGRASDRLLSSGFGSCVGVALVDSTTGVAGLSHSMLPYERSHLDVRDNHHLPARYVDTGIAALLAVVVDAGADSDSIVAKLVGGSRMFAFGGEEGSIGDRNIAAARETLTALDIPLAGEDVGEDFGRSVELDAKDGRLTVRRAHGGTVTL